MHPILNNHNNHNDTLIREEAGGRKEKNTTMRRHLKCDAPGSSSSSAREKVLSCGDLEEEPSLQQEVSLFVGEARELVVGA